MNILVIGGGGREHTIVKKIKEDPRVAKIYALPGNGGMTEDAECYPIGAKDLDGICAFAESHAIDFAIVAPDDPLVLGAVDRLTALGIPCFGPRANAAILEGSKVFSKNLMQKYNIPTAGYTVCRSAEEALSYLESASFPTVIKADGLALGKGVVIAQTKEEALAAVHSMMEDKIFGESGSTVVMEEFLTGPEVSVLCFTDGHTLRPMVSSMDHKRIGDNDEGPNTGGMGTIAPNPYYTDAIAAECMETIFLPTIRAMEAEGRPFTGCLYFGLMLTPKGPRVIEYNCRFGDPETQVVLPLLESNLLDIMMATANGTLAETPVVFAKRACACVVMASDGYPLAYETGKEITLPGALSSEEFVFVAGAKRGEDGKLLTSGGRVLNAVSLGDDLERALQGAYKLVDRISFDGAVYRHDIGQRALKALRKEG